MSAIWPRLAAASCLLLGGLARDARAQVRVLDPVFPAGISVTVGADGLGLISYIDFMGDGLNVAHCSDLACSSATITALDAAANDQFLATSIATGADGLGLIAYDTPGGMKVAHCSNVLCTQATTSSLGANAGTRPSLAIGSDGLGLIASIQFVSPGGASSGVAHCTDLACTSTSTPVGLPGGAGGITVGGDGLALIPGTLVPIPPMPPALFMSHCNDPACGSLAWIQVPGVLGASPIVTGTDGLGVMRSTSAVGAGVSRCADALCSTATSQPVHHGRGDLAIGSDGFPMLTFDDTGTLRLGHCEDADCSALAISDPIDASVAQTSLRIGSDGVPLIAYIQYGPVTSIKVAHCTMTGCPYTGPVLTVADAAVVEGDAGTVDAVLRFTLSEPSPDYISGYFDTWIDFGATATPVTDFDRVFPTVQFAPGEVAKTAVIPIVGDTTVEADEFFFARMRYWSGAAIGTPFARVTIVDDDAPSLSFTELAHGSDVRGDLAALPGPVAAVDHYRLGQSPRTSWEVVVDGLSGDVPPLLLERLAADNTTVLQTGAPATGGSSVSLRFENRLAALVGNQHLRLTSLGCGASCGPTAVYRLRAYETTGRIARFNNSATQTTVVVLENGGDAAVQGALWFWDVSGALLASQAFDLAARASTALNTGSIAGAGGGAGSITVTHDGAYGALAGKGVAVEPATGFTFDTELAYRPR